MSKRKIEFTEKFRDEMYENMWQFINLDVIKEIIEKATGHSIKVTRKMNIDEKFGPTFRNSICFKGEENQGHYIFVDTFGVAHGTYENNLLLSDLDDGVCHGAAMIYALGEDNSINGMFPLQSSPSVKEQYRKVYISILSFYRWLIISGIWDKTMKNHFYYDLHWNGKTSKESRKALKLLNNYITYIEKI